MATSRKISLAGGLLYQITFVSIPTAVLYIPVRDSNYIVGPGPDAGIISGGIREIIVALAGIGTADAKKDHLSVVSLVSRGERI